MNVKTKHQKSGRGKTIRDKQIEIDNIYYGLIKKIYNKVTDEVKIIHKERGGREGYNFGIEMEVDPIIYYLDLTHRNLNEKIDECFKIMGFLNKILISKQKNGEYDIHKIKTLLKYMKQIGPLYFDDDQYSNKNSIIYDADAVILDSINPSLIELSNRRKEAFLKSLH